MKKTIKHIVVGMSGGVDSSVTALLLKKKKYKVTGVFMRNWEDNEYECLSHQDMVDAISVADKIGIDIKVVNFSNEYKTHVFSNFLREYSLGNTPNPDILCNSKIKFDSFLNYAKTIGADYIATGHYAKILIEGFNVKLSKSIDKSKDQTYFLYRLNQYQLKNSLFPIGNFTKNQVRAIARQYKLHTATKKDSTGLCFLEKEKSFRIFIRRYLPDKPGPIVTIHHTEIGKHHGIHLYTIGQRTGLTIGGLRNRTSHNHLPWYVAQKNISNNSLIVVQGRNHPLLFRKIVALKDTSWITSTPVFGKVNAKIRHGQDEQSCEIINEGGGTISVVFDIPQWAVSPGQSIVFYKKNICLGGGIIV